MWLRMSSLAIFLALLAACAAQPLTPLQEKAYSAIEDCRRGWWSVRAVLVTPEGGLQIEGRADEVFKVKRCLEERYGYRFPN